MFKHYFEGIDGVAVYPIFSLVIFFVFFILLFFWVIKADKKYLKHMEEIPFDTNDQP